MAARRRARRVLVASAHHVLATDATNEYAAENLVHEREIFAQATSVPLPVATALVRSATGHSTPPLELPAAVPLLPTLQAAEVRVVDFSPTSPALHEGRWLAASAERDLLTEALPAHGAAIARFGETRLTRSRPNDFSDPRNVSLGVELRLATSQRVTAPWTGTVWPTEDGIELRTDELTLRVDGCRTSLTAGSSVAAGDPVAEASGHLWVQVARAGVAAPRFVAASVAAAWRTVVADPSALVPGAGAASGATDAAELLARRESAFADVQEHYYDEPPRIERGWREHLIATDGRVYLDMRQQRRLDRSRASAAGRCGRPAVAAAQHQLALPLPRRRRVLRAARCARTRPARHRLPGEQRLRGRRSRAAPGAGRAPGDATCSPCGRRTTAGPT